MSQKTAHQNFHPNQKLYCRAISMSGNLSSPEIINSRLDYSITKYAEYVGTKKENLKQSLLSLDFDALQQVHDAAYAPSLAWTKPEDEISLDFYYTFNTGDQ